MENNLQKKSLYIVYHTILHTRKPNFPSSTQVCVLNFQSRVFSTFFSCDCAFSTSRHGKKNDQPTSIASQLTVTCTPSGSKSSSFNAIFVIHRVSYRPSFNRGCLTHIRVCKYTLLFALSVELVFQSVQEVTIVYLVLHTPIFQRCR